MKVQLNLHLQLSNLANSERKKLLLTPSTFAQGPSTDAYKEFLHDAIAPPTTKSLLRLKRRRLSNISSILTHEDSRPGCAR
jgi:hypothetical protein